jgi:hypothetical protein
MKCIKTEGALELQAETDFERECLTFIHRHKGSLKITDGATSDREYPPSDALTNVRFVYVDPYDDNRR